MDAMGKYDVDRFLTPPDPDLVCCICKCVLHKPMESTCQHVFCKVCIKTWLNNHRSCPSCRRRLSSSGLKPVLPIVNNMINRLLIKCENISNGCTKGINLEQYSKHIKDCDYGLVGCLNSGCTRNILRKDMIKHEKECLYRLVKCKKGCGLPITVAGTREHSCILELKNNMQAMEDGFNKRLKELEDKFYSVWREVQNRVTSVERELDDSYRYSYRSYEDEPRRRYSHSRSSSSNGVGRSRTRSRSHSYSRGSSHSRSHSRSRDHTYSRSPASEDDYHSYDDEFRSWDPSERGSLSPVEYFDQEDLDEIPYGVVYNPGESTLGDSEISLDGSNRDSDEEGETFAELLGFPPPTVRITSSGSQTRRNTVQNSVRRGLTTSAATSSSNPPNRSQVSTSLPSQRRNQNQEQGEPSTEPVSVPSQSQPALESPESPPYRVNTRESTPGVVTPLVITRRPAVSDTPMSPPVDQQSGVAIDSPARRPVPPTDDRAIGSLYGVTVGETDSDDVEWQPQSGNASSDSWLTEDEDDGGEDTCDPSGNESNSEQPTTSHRRRPSASTSLQTQIASTVATLKVIQSRTETDEKSRRGHRRRHSPYSTSDEDSSSSSSSDTDSENSTSSDDSIIRGGQPIKRAKTTNPPRKKKKK